MIDKDLFQLVGKNKKYIFIAVLTQAIGLLASVSITASLCYSFYVLFEGLAFKKFILPIIVVSIAIIVKFIMTVLTVKVKDLLGRKVKKDLRSKIYNKIITLGNKNVDDLNMAGLTQVSLEGVEQLDLYYSSYLPQFFYAMLAPIMLFFITVGINFRVAIVLLCCVPLIPMSIILVSKYAKRIFNKYWGKYTSMGDAFLDSVQGLKELKIFEADGVQHEKMNESSEEFRKITMKVLVMQLASTTIMDLVAYGGAGLGIAVSILGVLHHNIDPFMSLFLILVAVEFFLPLRSFGSAFHIAMNGASAGRKIIDILAQDEPVWGEEKLANYELALEDVTFSYDQNRDVLKNVNLTFKEHELTAIVGASGCGKSTIVNLLIGANRAKSGKVLIGGKELETLNKEELFKHLGVVSYNTYIFNESIRDNFYLANDKLTDEEIYASLEKVNLKAFVLENGGLDKVITEDANNISGGERQRLSLAINLASNKDIYIFDEATSNIDIDSEKIIMDNVYELAKEKTVIVISHRLFNILRADKIYYLEAGEVKEAGNHESLVKANGGYKALYQTQKTLELGYLNQPCQGGNLNEN